MYEKEKAAATPENEGVFAYAMDEQPAVPVVYRDAKGKEIASNDGLQEGAGGVRSQV